MDVSYCSDHKTRQQYLYHLPDGPEQEERDRIMRMNPTPPGDPLVWRDPELSPWLLGYDHIKDVSCLLFGRSRLKLLTSYRLTRTGLNNMSVSGAIFEDHMS